MPLAFAPGFLTDDGDLSLSFRGELSVTLRILHLAAALGILVIGITLWSWGQPLISRSGEVRLWVGSIWSNENSQQIADWYTLSHFVQGMLVVLVGRGFQRWVGYRAMLAAAIVIGVSWEIVEHTELVLGQFRGATVYQGYVGDSVLNAVSDYLFMLAGFFLATALPTGWVALAAAAIEVTSALVARDSLTLTALQLVHPVPAIAAWQDAINPRTHPELLAPAP